MKRERVIRAGETGMMLIHSVDFMKLQDDGKTRRDGDQSSIKMKHGWVPVMIDDSVFTWEWFNVK